ncbi:MAG TPA: hypothetical protein DDZ39_04780 [Flavobacteriaceae bacterium]|nr:hypothetical protein [Flavobacteriaceae bacterium]HBS12569.1 hypothetical protein [Flavobacteriaceae bacterium]
MWLKKLHNLYNLCFLKKTASKFLSKKQNTKKCRVLLTFDTIKNNKTYHFTVIKLFIMMLIDVLI